MRNAQTGSLATSLSWLVAGRIRIAFLIYGPNQPTTLTIIEYSDYGFGGPSGPPISLGRQDTNETTTIQAFPLCRVSPGNKPFDRGRIHKVMEFHYLALAHLNHINYFRDDQFTRWIEDGGDRWRARWNSLFESRPVEIWRGR